MPQHTVTNDTSIRDMPERKWGIELELLERRNVLRDEIRARVAEALAAKNIERGVRVCGYGHDGPRNREWKIKTDSSCGYELTSPVLSNWRGLHELDTVMGCVDKYGDEKRARLINAMCGVHVHVDARDLEWNDVRNLALAMKIWEPIFFAMNPHSRFQNQYCREIQFSTGRMKRATNKDRIKDAWQTPAIAGQMCEWRHHGLNLEPWWRRGSIEFRYFAGTWAFVKATAAVMMCVLTVQAIKNKGSVRIPNSQLDKSFTQIWETAGVIGFDKYTDKFFRDFLQLRSGSCPAFGELRKYVKARIATFWNNDGSKKERRGS
jgi:hypothetical protein